jgi:hypothetical protein
VGIELMTEGRYRKDIMRSGTSKSMKGTLDGGHDSDTEKVGGSIIQLSRPTSSGTITEKSMER